MSYCKNCRHWKNHQRLLNYCDSTGFCLNEEFNFNIQHGRLVGVIDTENQRDRTKIEGNPSHDFEATTDTFRIKHSRYMLQTLDVFGCNYFSPIKTKK